MAVTPDAGSLMFRCRSAYFLLFVDDSSLVISSLRGFLLVGIGARPGS